ncbi:MAG: hypothetical protein ACLFTT_03495 [Candidatus Hydrogenedentota bacterium]
MNISKEQAIFIAIIGALLAVALGVTYFYVMPKIEEYQEDERIADQLEATFQEFQDTFHGVQPDVIISEMQRRTQPWMDAREDWGEPFSLGDWAMLYEQRPEEMFARFWYDEESQRLLDNLRETIRTDSPRLEYPRDLRSMFGVATLDDWKNMEKVTERMARRELDKLSCCISMFDYLLEYDPIAVEEMTIWPNRVENATGSWLVFRTMGLAFTMRLGDLIDFLEEMRLEERYFNVDRLQVRWDYPWYQPELDVKMLVTQAHWVPPEKRGGKKSGQATVAARPGQRDAGETTGSDLQRRLSERSTQREQVYEEPGAFSKMWTWFKRNVLYISG